MPYVNEETKEHLQVNPHGAITCGMLTYQLQQVVNEYLLTNTVSGLRSISYDDHIAVVTAALEQCRRDFDERITAPYEAKKRAENGDVWDERILSWVTS